MSLFLPREIGSIETGPQTFAGTNISNTAFVFTKEPLPSDPPGLFNSVLVQNAGQNTVNGVFDYITIFEEKPYYVSNSNPDLFIIWFDNQWQIYDYFLDNLPLYFSSENVLYPWVVTNWIVQKPIYNPAPTVTKVL